MGLLDSIVWKSLRFTLDDFFPSFTSLNEMKE